MRVSKLLSMPMIRLLLGGVLCLSVVGCPKKSTDTATKDDDKSTKSKTVEGYTHGDVLKHVPAKCSAVRLYLDLGAIRKLDGVGSNLEAFQDTAIDSAGSGAKQVKKALKALDAEGIDPKNDLQELAICVGDDKSVAVAIGGSVKGKDVLGAVEKALEAVDEGKVEKKKKKGLTYLSIEKVVIGMASDTVMVIASDESALADLVEENDVSSDWDQADGRLVSGFFGRHSGGEKDLDVTGSIDASGGDLVLAVKAKAKGSEAKKNLDEEAPKAKKEIKDGLGVFADGMEKLSSGLAEDIRGAKVTIEDGVISGKMTVKTKNLSKALDKGAKMDSSELEGLFK